MDNTIYVVSFLHKDDYGERFVPRGLFVNNKDGAIALANEMLEDINKAKGCKSVDRTTSVAISFVNDGEYCSLSENCCIHKAEHEIKFA